MAPTLWKRSYPVAPLCSPTSMGKRWPVQSTYLVSRNSNHSPKSRCSMTLHISILFKKKSSFPSTQNYVGPDPLKKLFSKMKLRKFSKPQRYVGGSYTSHEHGPHLFHKRQFFFYFRERRFIFIIYMNKRIMYALEIGIDNSNAKTHQEAQ